MGTLAVVVVLTLLVSAVCSLLEAALYSSRVGALEAASAQGNRTDLARRFLQMKREISIPIAAILVLNTVANTAGATFSGMYAAQVFGPVLVPVFSLGLILAILFLSEILPKTLGALYWYHLWPFLVRPLEAIQFGLYPAVYVTEKFSKLCLKERPPPPVTEGEILAMARLGAKAGEISSQESHMIQNIIGLEDKQVRDVLTPRSVLFSLDASTPVQEALEAVKAKEFSRVPIYEEERENIIAYITLHDLSSGEPLPCGPSHPQATTLKTLAKPITFIPDTANCLSVLTTFLKHRRHIAIVAGEYGGVAGLITLEDLIETALGAEIMDETDHVADLRAIARQRRPQVLSSC